MFQEEESRFGPAELLNKIGVLARKSVQVQISTFP